MSRHTNSPFVHRARAIDLLLLGVVVGIALGRAVGYGAQGSATKNAEDGTARGDGMRGEGGDGDSDKSHEPHVVSFLDSPTLRARAIEVFPGAYTTLSSIIQGLALAAIAVQVSPALDGASLDGGTVLQSVVALSTVFIVWYMYVWFVIVVRWAPTVADSAIPFLLGGFELFLIDQIGQEDKWVLAAGLMFGAGAIAFAHSWYRTDEHMFKEPKDYRAINRLYRLLTVVNGVGCAVAIAAYSLDPWPLSESALVPLVSWCTLAAIFSMISVSEATLSRLFDRHGLRWWRRSGPTVSSPNTA